MNACTDYLHTIRRLRSRREALSGLARLAIASVGSALLPALIPRVAFGTPGSTRDVLVCIFLRGGADGLSFVGPYAEDAYYTNRPTIAIPKPNAGDLAAGLALDSLFAIHPSLSGLKALYDAGSLAVVHATGSVDPTRSHFDAMRSMEQATPEDKTKNSGWIARHLASLAMASATPLRAVGFGGSVPASLRGVTGVTAIAIDDLDYFGLDVDDSQAAAMQTALETMYGTSNPSSVLGIQAGLAFETINQLDGLSATDYVAENGAAYPDSYFAFGLKQTALLIKKGLGLEVACLDFGDWDTHENAGTNDGYLRDHLKEMGDSIAAFIRDLGTRMDRVTVVTMSEFGRRVEENASHGTDHGHGNVMFLAGGGVNGGKVYGSWPTLAEDQLADGDLAITTDQRDILRELASKRLGNTALAATFPSDAIHPYTPGPDLGIFKPAT